MSGKDQLLKFPCEFPIKVMGRISDSFEKDVIRIFERHVEDLDSLTVSSRPSGSGNFISVTVTFRAQSQQQLDAIYRDLTENEKVLFCL